MVKYNKTMERDEATGHRHAHVYSTGMNCTLAGDKLIFKFGDDEYTYSTDNTMGIVHELEGDIGRPVEVDELSIIIDLISLSGGYCHHELILAMIHEITLAGYRVVSGGSNRFLVFYGRVSMYCELDDNEFIIKYTKNYDICDPAFDPEMVINKLHELERNDGQI